MPNAAPDTTYNLVSVLYHALKGTQTADRYLEDAQSRGDTQIAAFFEQVGEQQRELALRAQRLLGEHLHALDQHNAGASHARPVVPLDSNARVGEASRESFPASDPPAY